MELFDVEAVFLEELHRLVAVTHALLLHDDVRPFHLVRVRLEAVHEEVADALARRLFLGDDVHGLRHGAFENLRVEVAVERHDELDVFRLVLKLQNVIEVFRPSAAQAQARALDEDFFHRMMLLFKMHCVTWFPIV